MLGDLLADVVAGLVDGPATDRGRVVLFSTAGAVAMIVELWLRASVGDPVGGPSWAFSLFTLCVVAGIAGLVVGLFALVRRRPSWPFSLTCVFFNGVALLVAFARDAV